MNIFIAFNDDYVLPTRVMLKSLIMNNACPLDVFVFFSSLKQESIDAIKGLEEEGRVSFRFQQVEDAFLDDIDIPGYFSKETYYRLFAHRLFSEDIERVLWLDGDLIINGPLDEFYDQDFKGSLYAAVEDSGTKVVKRQKETLRMPADSKYINTGVLLFNLKQMRKELNDGEIIQYLRDNQKMLLYPDQDVLNGLLHDRIIVAYPNWMYNLFCWRITNENKREAYANARVIHYCGKRKPWRYYDHPAADIWWKYARLTGPEYNRLFRKLYVSHMVSKCKKLAKRSAKKMLPQPVYDRIKEHCRSSLFHRGKHSHIESLQGKKGGQDER